MRIALTRSEYGDLVNPAVFFFRPKSVGALRVAVRVLEKLEEAGAPTGPKGRDGFESRRIAADEQTFDFEVDELGVIVGALEEAAAALPAGIARGLPALLDRITATLKSMEATDGQV